MSGQIHVEPAALAAFERSSTARSEQLDGILQRLNEAEVSWISFGLMPASFQLRDIYNQQTTDCLDGVRETVEFLADVADAMTATRVVYEAGEEVNTNLSTGGQV